MRASFDVEQPDVRSVTDGDNIYIFICQNGEWYDRKYDENEAAQRVWECDYNEIATTIDKINIDDVNANPAKYLNWTGEKTADEKLADLETKNEMLTQCLLEMSETVYA